MHSGLITMYLLKKIHCHCFVLFQNVRGIEEIDIRSRGESSRCFHDLIVTAVCNTGWTVNDVEIQAG